MGLCECENQKYVLLFSAKDHQLLPRLQRAGEAQVRHVTYLLDMHTYMHECQSIFILMCDIFSQKIWLCVFFYIC